MNPNRESVSYQKNYIPIHSTISINLVCPKLKCTPGIPGFLAGLTVLTSFVEGRVEVEVDLHRGFLGDIALGRALHLRGGGD